MPIKSFLDASGPNTLTISIAPAYNTTLEEQAKYPYFIPTLYVSAAAAATAAMRFNCGNRVYQQLVCIYACMRLLDVWCRMIDHGLTATLQQQTAV